MILISKDKTFSLTNRFFSYVFRVSPEGILEHLYYGGRLSDPLGLNLVNNRVPRGGTVSFQDVPNYNLNAAAHEFPCYGTSDFRYPAFHGLNSDGNSIFVLQYKKHEVTKQKNHMTDLPSARGGDCETLIITLEDSAQKLLVQLYYTIYVDHGVLIRSIKFENKSDAEIMLEHVFSSVLNLPTSNYEIMHFNGSWSRELNENRMDVPAGRFVIESARGASSAAHSPFIAMLDNGTTEDSGRVYSTSLVYSGNFAINVEKGEFGDVRVLTGINPFNFKWCLKPGEEFSTPEALLVYTDKGLRGMSHIWHDFIREKISPPTFKNKPRPTYLNTWEAAYFDVNEKKVLELADKAKQLGIQMLVLDDGWFEGRNNDTSSLGDWVADKDRFPNGLAWLASKVKSKSLKFGIWVEPEMVNPKSQLYDLHPDWILHVPKRKPSLGRNQLILDLSREDVTDYLFEQMDTILSCGDIDYVKWDMNRNMTEVGSSSLPISQQREVSHRYMLGLYRLLARLTQKYPNVLFENCASGGNRFDLGMLNFMSQAWISDMCDPVGRLEIINSASYLFPLDVIAAYVGPSPNHQNGRISSIQTRFLAGVFCASRGLSLSESDLANDRDKLDFWTNFANRTSDDMVGGRFDRLIKNDNETCWQYSTRDKSKIYLVYFHVLSAPNLPLRQTRLVGLDRNASYVLKEDSVVYNGDALMQNGIVFPYVSMDQSIEGIRYMEKGDFSSFLFEFEKVN